MKRSRVLAVAVGLLGALGLALGSASLSSAQPAPGGAPGSGGTSGGAGRDAQGNIAGDSRGGTAGTGGSAGTSGAIGGARGGVGGTGAAMAGMSSTAGAHAAPRNPDASDCEESTSPGNLSEPEHRELTDEGSERASYCCAGQAHGFPHIQEPFCRLYCDAEEIYCVNEYGDPLDDETLPSLWPGRQVIVRVVALQQRLQGKTVRLMGSDSEDETRVRLDGNGGATNGAGGSAVTAGSAGSPAPAAATPHAAASCRGSCDEFRVASYEGLAPSGSSSYAVRLSIEDAGGVMRVQRTYRFPVSRGGQRYFEVGIVLPFTFDGTRKIGEAPFSGTGVRTIEVEESLSWAFGLGISIYPFGVWETRAEDPRDHWFKHLVAPLGLGFATNVFSDRPSFTEGYLTLNYRVSSGAMLGIGVSAVKGQFLKSQWAELMPLPPDVTLSQVVEDRYMFRPHLALTISPDALAGLLGLLSQVRSASDGKTFH
jgi:hypothetical protein